MVFARIANGPASAFGLNNRARQPCVIGVGATLSTPSEVPGAVRFLVVLLRFAVR